MSKRNIQEKNSRINKQDQSFELETPKKRVNQSSSKSKIHSQKKNQSQSIIKEYVTKDSKDISRLSIESEKKVESNNLQKITAILNLRQLLKHKIFKLNYRFFCRTLLRQKKFKSSIRILILIMKTKQYNLKFQGINKLKKNSRFKKLMISNMNSLIYFWKKFIHKKVSPAFKKIVRLNISQLRKKNVISLSQINKFQQKDSRKIIINLNVLNLFWKIFQKNKYSYVFRKIMRTNILLLKKNIVIPPLTIKLKEDDPQSSRKNLNSSRNLKKIEEQKLLNASQIELIYKQNQELKIMALSNQIRDSLMKLQRFDRYIYPTQSQKILKQPAQNELKRLQKIKNSAKTMRTKYYDNQLTITALVNHIKTIYQMNRQLKEIDILKKEKQQLQKKIIENNIQKNKQIKQLMSKRGINAQQYQKNKTNENQAKQIHKLNQIIFNTIKQGNSQKIKKTLQDQLKMYQRQTTRESILDRKQFLEIILNLLNNKVQIQPTISNIDQILNQHLKSLFQQKSDVSKHIQQLEQLKLIFINDRQDQNQYQNKLRQNLSNGCTFIKSLLERILQKDNQISKIKLDLFNITKQMESHNIEKIGQFKNDKIRQFKNEYNFSQWEYWLKDIIKRINNKLQWHDEMQKQLKNLQQNQTDKQKYNIISLNLDILNILKAKQVEIQTLNNLQNQQKIHDQYKIYIEENYISKQLYQKQIFNINQQNLKLKQQLQSTKLKIQKMPLPIHNTQINELIKLCVIIDTALLKFQNENQVVDWIKIKRQFENKKKFNVLLQIITTIQNILKFNYDSEDRKKKQNIQKQKLQNIRIKQINMIMNQNQIIMKLFEDENIKQQGFINKSKKSMENILSKFQKINQVSNPEIMKVVKDSIKSKIKLIKLLEEFLKQKNSDQYEKKIRKLEIELENYNIIINNKQVDRLQLKNQNQNLHKQLNKLRLEFQTSIPDYSDKIKKLEQQKNILQTSLKKKQNDLKKVQEKCKSLQSKKQQYFKQIKSYKEVIQVYGYEQKIMLQKIQQAQNKNIYNQNKLEILERNLKDYQRQKNYIEQQKQNIKKIKQQNLYLQKKIKEKQIINNKIQKQKNQKINQLELQIKKIEGNLKQLLLINEHLETLHQNEQISIKPKIKQENLQKIQQQQKNALEKKFILLTSQFEKLSEEHEMAIKQNRLLLEKIEYNQKENQILSQEIIKLEINIGEKEKQYNRIKQYDKNENLKQKQQTISKINQLINQNKKLNEQILNLKNILKLKKQNEKLKFEKQQNQNKEKRNNDNQIRELNNQLNSCKNIIIQLQEKIKENIKKQKRYQQSFIELKEKLERVIIENQKLKIEQEEEYKKKQQEWQKMTNQRFKNERQECKKKQVELLRQIEKLKKGIEKSRLEKKRKQISQEERTEIELLRKEITALQVNAKQTEQTVSNTLTLQLKNQESYFINIIHQLEAKISVYKSNQAKLSNQLQVLSKEITTLQVNAKQTEQTVSNTLTLQLKNQESYFINIIHQLEAKILVYQSNQAKLSNQLQVLSKEITALQVNAKQTELTVSNTLTLQLKNQESYFINIIHQLEAKISVYKSNQAKLSNQLQVLSKEITALQVNAKQTEQNVSNTLTLQLKNQESYFINIIHQLEAKILVYQSNQAKLSNQLQVLSKEITALQVNAKQTEQTVSNTLTLQLKNQESYFINIIHQLEAKISVYQSNQAKLSTQIQGLRKEITTLQVNAKQTEQTVSNTLTLQLKNQESYFINIIHQLEAKISVYQSNQAKLSNQLQVLSKEITTLQVNAKQTEQTVSNTLTLQLKNQESYFINIIHQLEAKISVYQSNQAKLSTQIQGLRKEITTLQVNAKQTEQTVSNTLTLQLKNQESYFINIIHQLEAKILVYQSNQAKLSNQLQVLSKEITALQVNAKQTELTVSNTLTLQLKNQESYFINIIHQLEAKILVYQSNQAKLSNQLQVLSKEITTLQVNAKQTEQTVSNTLTLQLKNQESYFINIIHQLEAKILVYQSNQAKLSTQIQGLRKEITALQVNAKQTEQTVSNTLTLQLKNQESYFINIIHQLEAKISVYQSNQAKLSNQLQVLSKEITTLQVNAKQTEQTVSNTLTLQLKNQESYFINIIHQLEAKISVYQSNQAKLSNQLQVLSKEITTLQVNAKQTEQTVSNTLTLQLKNQESYFINIIHQLEAKISVYQSNQAKLSTQIQGLRKEITTLQVNAKQTEQNVSNTLTLQLKNQESYFINIIHQLEAKISVYQSNQAKLSNQLQVLSKEITTLQVNAKQTEQTVSNTLTLQLKNQESYFINIIHQLEAKILVYQSNQAKLSNQLQVLSKEITTLQVNAKQTEQTVSNTLTLQLKNQESYFINIIHQLEAKILVYQSNQAKLSNQLQVLSKEITALQVNAKQTELTVSNTLTLQLKNQESYFINIIHQLEAKISVYQSNQAKLSTQIQGLRKEITTLQVNAKQTEQTVSNTLTLQLKNQESYFINIIHQLEANISVYQSNQAKLSNQLQVLSKEITTLQVNAKQTEQTVSNTLTLQLKNQESYFINIIHQLEAKISVYQSNQAKLSNQLQVLSKEITTLQVNAKQTEQTVSNTLTLQLKNQESYFINIIHQLEAKISVYQSNQAKLSTQIQGLRKEITTLQVNAKQTEQTVSNTLTLQLKNQESYFINIIHQLEAKISVYQSNSAKLTTQIQSLRNQLSFSKSQLQAKSQSSQLKFKQSSFLTQISKLQNIIHTQHLQFLTLQQKSLQLQTQLLQLKHQQSIRQSQSAKYQSQTNFLNNHIKTLTFQLIQKDSKILQLQKKLTISFKELQTSKNQLKLLNISTHQLNQKLKKLEINYSNKQKEYKNFTSILNQEKQNLLNQKNSILQKNIQLQSQLDNISSEKKYLHEKITDIQDLINNQQQIYKQKILQDEFKYKELQDYKNSLEKQVEKSKQKNISKELNNILSPKFHQNKMTELRLEKQIQENKNLKDKIKLLQQNISETNRQFKNDDYSSNYNQKYLLKTQGEIIKQNISKIEKANLELNYKINQLANQNDPSDDDLNEINVLKKVNQQITELVESNKLLVARIRSLQNQNKQIHDNLRLYQSYSQAQLNILPLTHLHQSILNIEQYLQSDDIGLQNQQIVNKYNKKLEFYLNTQNFYKYIDTFQQFLKIVITELLEEKNQILAKQANNLLELKQKMAQIFEQQIQQRQIQENSRISSRNAYQFDYNNQQEDQRKNLIVLQHLFRLYKKSKNPEILEQINSILNEPNQQQRYQYRVNKV